MTWDGLSGDGQATAEDLLRELAEELAGYHVCPFCSRLQWRHKRGCIMPEVYRRFGIEPKEEDYDDGCVELDESDPGCTDECLTPCGIRG